MKDQEVLGREEEMIRIRWVFLLKETILTMGVARRKKHKKKRKGK